jgi:hypothetical protein
LRIAPVLDVQKTGGIYINPHSSSIAEDEYAEQQSTLEEEKPKKGRDE